jgi:hypothetical protein
MKLTKKQKTLLRAVRRQNVPQVKALLEDDRLDPDFPRFSATTPLHEAVKKNHLLMVKMLAGAGADINCQTKNGLTPLDLARKNNAVHIVRYLLGEGAGASMRTLKRDRKKPQAKKSAFKAEALADIFAAEKWVGKAEEMQREWEKVPARLKDDFDFAAALAEARQGTLKGQTPSKKILRKNPPKPSGE